MQPVILMAGSVSEALSKGLTMLAGRGGVVHEPSRNGGVAVWDGPVVTHTLYPLRRVLFSPLRNANPFFHLFEALWMLGGRNDLPWLAQFNKQMAAYSDDGGKTQPAAYGHRWRNYFGYDQLPMIINELRKNPGTRRAVLGMWDAWGIHQLMDAEGTVNHFGDLMGVEAGSADVPCNTQCYFTARDGKLNMAVTCRSNDILWGAHGANAVHFSILLEYIAAWCGYEVGEMTQFSWNYHQYDGILKHDPILVAQDLLETDRYTGRVNPTPVTPIFDKATMGDFERDLPTFLDWAAPEPQCGAEIGHPFLKNVALPMLAAWRERNDFLSASGHTGRIAEYGAHDWAGASYDWLKRRALKRGDL